jgi:curved DNA-binding protein CbpA
MPLMQEAKLELAFKSLGVAQSATADEVKAAFRKLARECHPDTSRLPKDEAEQRFRALNEAYAYIRQKQGW